MNRHIPLPILCALVLVSGSALAGPPAARVDVVNDEYFGITVADPYRYLENLRSPEVRQWMNAQASYARQTLDAIPGRSALLKEIQAADRSVTARIGAVSRLPGELYFYEKRGAADNQFKLFVRKGLSGKEMLLVDPQSLARRGGKPQAINYFSASPRGKYVAYGLSENGSENASIHVIDVANRKKIGSSISRAQYPEISWLPDESGFFYNRLQPMRAGMPETDKYQDSKNYLHRLKGGADKLILSVDHNHGIALKRDEFPTVRVDPQGKFAYAIPAGGVQPEFSLYISPLNAAHPEQLTWRKLFDAGDDITDFAVRGHDLYVLSHHEALRYKLLRTSLDTPDLNTATVIIPPSEQVLVALADAQDGLYIQARDGSTSKLYKVDYQGDQPVTEVPLPLKGAVEMASVDPRLNGILLNLGSWTRDNRIFAWDPLANQLADTGLQPMSPLGAPTDIESVEVKVKSHDGVEIPLSIVYPTGIRLDGNNPAWLYGYGAYGITDDPVFIPRFLPWYRHGGILATCHVRGGGAYGEEWHLAGKIGTKPNTWKDFIACGEYLVAHGYASTRTLGISGGSAGGILVGRAMTERPDLFAVAVPQVGVLNPLRAELSANGVPNIPEFGTVKIESQFRALLEMDAYQHVVNGTTYPATLLMHGANDPRVDPWNSLKMAARLQAAEAGLNAGKKPVLLSIDYQAGHGIGSTNEQREQEYADMWAFMLWQFGVPGFQPE